MNPSSQITWARSMMPWRGRIAAWSYLLLALWGGAAGAQTIGFSQVGTESDWRTAFSADMQAEAKRRGITLLFQEAGGNVDNQFKAVHSFVERHVDAIVIAPVVVTGWTAALKEAQAAHIPVFVVDRAVDVDPSLFVARIAANFNLEGRLAGAWLAQASRGRCNIVELQGTLNSAPAIERHKGFDTIISQFSDMHIVLSKSGDFTAEGGQKVMEEFIAQTHGLREICAVWSHNDNMILGAIEAMKAHSLQPGHSQLMVSVDGVPGIYQALAKGDANASVELKSDIGKYIFDVVQGYLAGKRDYPKWVVIPSDLHTQADAADLMSAKPEARN